MDEKNTYQGGISPSGTSSSTQGEGAFGRFTPLSVLRIILRRWLTVLLLTIFGGLGGILYGQLAPRVYIARSKLEMSVRRPQVIKNEAVFEDASIASDTDVIFNTRFAKFKAPAMERLAAHEFLKRYPDLHETEAGESIGKYTLAQWIRQVYWFKDPSANIVHVSFENEDPEFAAQLINVLTYCAGVLMMEENQAQSDEAVKWLVVQVEDQREFLEGVESQLAEIRDEIQLDFLQQRKATLQQTLISISEERELLISTLASRKTVYDFVSELKDSDPNLEMLPAGLPKEAQLNELIKVWRAANDEFLLAEDRYTDIHPEYRKAAEKEDRARKRLGQFIDLSAKSVQNEIELLGKQLKQVDQRIEARKSEALALESRLVKGLQRLQRLERKRDAADTTYQTMLRRMEEARLSADENMAYTKVIREAAVPKTPVRPRKMRALIIGIVLGMFSGCGFLIVTVLWTDRITEVNDLKALGLNILGTIPTQRKGDSRTEMATIGLRDKFSQIVEVFAGINTLLTSDTYRDRARLVLISSIMPGEGKTISACNLAISSAMNGSRTLLIDGDLRRPRLVDIFDVDKEHPSLLEWLSPNGKNLHYDQLASENVIENLDVITSRQLKDVNPAELLGRGQLANLLNWAKEHYDRVVIDSPPLGPVGDALLLAGLADSVIMVSRVGKTRRRGLRFSLARFRDLEIHVLGCIANDVSNSLVGMFGGAEGYGYNGYGNYKPYGKD